MASGSDQPDPNSETPAAPLSPARRMLRDFEAVEQQRTRRRARPILVVVLALAVGALVLFAAWRKWGRRPCVGKLSGAQTPPGGLAAVKPVEATKLMSSGNAGLEPLPATSVPVTPLPPGPPPEPRTNVERALATWPVAFEDPLGEKACLERAWLFRGQYGGHFHIHGGGLAISGVHTNSACWWNCLVGDCYALSLDFRFAGSVPFILLSGPGYGSHPAVGYALRLPVEGDALTIELRRHGALLGLPLREAPFRPGDWHRLDVLRDRDCIAVRLDGRMLGQWQDPEPLRGAMHAFVGLGSELGRWGDDRPHFRNLAIRMPQEDAGRLAREPLRRVLDPPITVPPQTNGERLWLDDFAADGFERWTAVQRADAAKVRNGKLVLRGPNAWPVVWRDEPVTGSVAVEFRMAYFPNNEAVNFNARLRLGDFPNPEKRTVFHGWQLGFPGGNGEVWLSWINRQGKGRVVARTAYFPATHGRPYTLRFELSDRLLRVFVNGGFLLEGVAPEPVAADVRVYPGLFQIYGGSLVERVEAWRIADLPDPGLVAGVAAETVDFGPRLAAAGSYFAAFEADVRPLLADRKYAEAADVLTQLGFRPEFRLAAERTQLAQTDVARLMRLWAAVPPRPDLAGMKASDVLALLGADFLESGEARLQAALFLLFDRLGEPRRALELLDRCADQDDARRYRALAARALAVP